MTDSSAPSPRRRAARVLVGLLLALIVGLLGVAYFKLPTIAPRYLVEYGYDDTGDRVFYSGLKVDETLEDMTEVRAKRFFLVPGPPRLEVLRHQDGRIAIVSTEQRKAFLYSEPMEIPEFLKRR